MRCLVPLAALLALPLLLPAQAAKEVAGKGETVRIVRDDFGIPHIFADSEEGVAYGMGYAQAEDRLEEVLKQYRRAEGTMAEAFGPSFLRHDYRQRLWRHRDVARTNYPKLAPRARSIIEAYVAGLNAYMKENPREVPTWAPEVQPWHIVALGRMIIWGWPEGQAGGDLARAGILPDPVAPRGSNQWVVAASRTADGFPLALIDPHLSWYGEFRFYEARLYGGSLSTSGMAIPGLPLTNLGHNCYLSIAMTTGGPDCGDIYEVEVEAGNPRSYRYDGKVREMTVRTETLDVRVDGKVEKQRLTFESTHHGPVIARRGNKAYAARLSYTDEFRLMEQGYLMATARNIADVKKALSLFQLMPQNVMVATVDGDTFYVRNGRVPVRPAGYDWTKPVPGNTSKTEWQGLHALDDLLSLHNPWQGYMQNCNVAPEHMMHFCPLTPKRFADRFYLYNRDNPLHQRAATTLRQLHAATRMTVPEAMAIAMSTEVNGADLWQARLASALGKAKPAGDAARLGELVLRWNRRADADSVGAIAYRYWKEQFHPKVLDADRAGLPPPAEVTDAQLLKALEGGAAKLKRDWGRLEVKYGEVYRVGREGGRGTWPVGGGNVRGLATPRAISFQPSKDGKTFVGRGGQTAVQLVQLSNPPRSWTLLPLGQSDRRGTPHFDDQAEKLFSPGKLKPTHFMDREGLKKHTRRTTIIERPR